MLLKCTSPLCISGKAIRCGEKWRITPSIIFPLGEVLTLKDVAASRLLLSVALTLAALMEKQL